jgi:hypothetical protein
MPGGSRGKLGRHVCDDVHPVTPSGYNGLCELADQRRWRVELAMIAGLLRLVARDETGAALTRPVRFDPRDRDASALRLIDRMR